LKKALAIVFLVLIADQILKVYIKTHFTLGEGYPIFGSWSYLLFIENEGMAFGWKFMGKHGKLFLSIFRIIAATGIAYYLSTIIRRKAKTGMIVAFSLILAGAVGNIIDSALYGLLFTESTMLTRAAFDPSNGYATFLHGKVVDMFYFPMVEGFWPDWKIIPAGLRGDHFLFFRPVFNLADSSITVGVLILLLFQKRFFHHSEEKVAEEEVPADTNPSEEPDHEPALQASPDNDGIPVDHT
jgi:signal peptidase II